MIFATFRFELLHFESRKPLEIYSFGALPYRLYIFVLLIFRYFCKRTGFVRRRPVRMRKIGIFATFPLELLQFESGKTAEIDCFGSLFYPP